MRKALSAPVPLTALVLVFLALVSLVALADSPMRSQSASKMESSPSSSSSSSATSVIPASPPPAEVAEMLDEISPDRLIGTVERLAAFGTRHTLSDTESDTRGIGAARRWILAQFEGYAEDSPVEDGGPPRLAASLDRHVQAPDGRRIPRETEIVNVMAVLPGALPAARDRHYYVIGHYDSRATDVMDAESDAPGADDDASGVALVMELARVMSKRSYDATLVFMATAGEEQGLYGAGLHARAAKEAGENVAAVLSNDVVGDPSSPLGDPVPDRVRVFSPALPPELSKAELRRLRALGAELDSPSRELARYVREVGLWHGTAVQPMVVFRTDRFLRGGDHTAFTDQGFTAVRFTEVDETYTRQHQNVREEDGVRYGDVPELVDAEYLAGVTRLNGAVLDHLANAPSPPGNPRILIAGLANDTTLRWDASPEPDVAGYEVVWRETAQPFWQHAKDVGKVTQVTLPLSKDNHFFGLRAYDTDGYRSPVVFAGAGRE
jgi:Zn-dependent M28 family amino/carboxypeptidase